MTSREVEEASAEDEELAAVRKPHQWKAVGLTSLQTIPPMPWRVVHDWTVGTQEDKNPYPKETQTENAIPRS